jgi:hypothetical protein
MTSYTSKIAMGESYADLRTGIVGYADILVFNENGCVEVDLEWTETNSNGGVEVRRKIFNENRLTMADGSPIEGTVDYESDVELGRQYGDVQTGLVGWACAIEFHERMATRVIIRSLERDKDHNPKGIKMHVIDDFLLQDVETKAQAERKTEKPSPYTREFTGRG